MYKEDDMRIIVIFVMLAVVFLNTLSVEVEAAINLESNTQIVSSFGADQDSHSHSCDENDQCGHQCHIGHCSCLIGEVFKVTRIEESLSISILRGFSQKLLIFELYRPPKFS
jgi:hypothetical protein